MSSPDTAWLLTATALVLFMTLPGLALFYGGLVRARNVVSVLMHCFAICCVVSIGWMVIGYSIAFGPDAGWFGGFDAALLLSLSRAPDDGSTTELLTVVFQMTFAIITPALIVGAFVERIKFGFVMLFSLLWMLLCYAPVAHWVWGGGILSADSSWGLFNGVGVQDLAGGVVVHETAGIAALVLAILVGRAPRFPEHVQPPHRPVLVMIGASMLWVGWFGFNGGSPGAANNDAVSAVLVTHLSAATASLTWLGWEWLRHGKPSLVGIVTGMVAGLASITPASGHVGPVGALIIGGVAGILCQEAIGVLKRRCRVDDSLDVFAVHGLGGIWGALVLPFLAAESLGGAGLGGVEAGTQFTVQLVGILIVLAYTLVVTAIIAVVCRALVGIRVHDEVLNEGLDINIHGERGYDHT